MSRRIPLIIVAGTALLAVMIAPAAAVPDGPVGGSPATAELSGDQEVPPNSSDASGHAALTINRGRERICYELSWQDLTAPATAAHIHVGVAGVAGDIVVPLDTTPTTTGTVSDCVGVERDLAKEISKNLESYYVNVHTSTFPGGEVRGQLAR